MSIYVSAASNVLDLSFDAELAIVMSELATQKERLVCHEYLCVSGF